MLINKDYKVKTVFFILLFTSFLTGCASYGSRSYSLITPEVRSSTSDKKNIKILSFNQQIVIKNKSFVYCIIILICSNKNNLYTVYITGINNIC